MLSLVQRGEFFPSSRTTHHHCVAVFGLSQKIQVKRMQRLTGFHHHEVRHIHDIVDRTNAHLLEATAQPSRTRANLHAPNGAGVVARAKIRIIELHGHNALNRTAGFG